MLSENHPYKSLLAGTFAGISSKLIEYPFDTLKVLAQTKHTDQNAFKQKSKSAIYRGVYIPVLFSSLENATMFYSYSVTQKYLNDKLENTNLKNSLSGLFSGLCVSTILTPSELIKCKLQHNFLENKKESMMSFVKTIYSKNGLTGFYRGHMSTMCREGLGTTIYFSTYEKLKQQLYKFHNNDEIPIWKMAIAGSISGICYWTSIFPVDTIKSNFQTSQSSYQKIITNIYKKYGATGFYKGYCITAFRAIISNFFIFYSYELGIRVL
jgi:hypothetical protein